MSLTDPSKRLEAMPPYMFAGLERKVSEMKERGIDVISLGIGDPDMPTYRAVVESMREAVGENSNQKYPTNRGRAEFRRRDQGFGQWPECRKRQIQSLNAPLCNEPCEQGYVAAPVAVDQHQRAATRPGGKQLLHIDIET